MRSAPAVAHHTVEHARRFRDPWIGYSTRDARVPSGCGSFWAVDRNGVSGVMGQRVKRCVSV